LDVAKWFEPNDRSSAINLVHGVFGAGKSYLLVIVIMFICHLLDESPNQDVSKRIRIMVSSVTNVAVDRILQGLIKEGFDSLVRVGSQKKIAKSILPYTISSDKSQNDVIKDLKSMLKEELEDDELEGVKKALEEIKSGVADKRKDSIKDVRVVGVTCAATAFQVLQGNKFPILILDESSQCLEPLALLPLSRFASQKLIAVGDPLQLPPTLVGASSNDNHNDSLEKTLFIRLSNVGFTPTMLRTQYRCHPRISTIPNQMFYDNVLMDGVDEESRSPLIPDMPPVMVIDVPNGKEQTGSDGSSYNEEEIKATTHLVKMLLASGATVEQIGIIALYRSQSFKLRLALVTEGMKAVKVSTVDAFQGGEREIILLTCCRTSSNLSFIENKKRLNVALTRARRHLLIVCCKNALNASELWRVVFNQAALHSSGVLDIKEIENRQNFDFLSDNPFDDDTFEKSVKKKSPLKLHRNTFNENTMNARQVPLVRKKKAIIDDDDDQIVIDKEEGECEFDFGDTDQVDSPSLKRKVQEIEDDDQDYKKKRRVIIPDDDDAVDTPIQQEKKNSSMNDSLDDFGIEPMPDNDLEALEF
jgi:hypothetical protein